MKTAASTARPLGRFILKGFQRVVEVVELAGRTGQTGAFEERDQRFADALARFQTGDFEAARERFQEVLAIVPGDGPSQFYLRRISDLARQPPGAGWRGEVELREK